MTPIRFGGEHREMVGFYHPPAHSSANPAVLICSPFGPEAIRSYRMLRLLADKLADAGCAVLRFDYFGTGDSPGDDESASLAGWAGDIGLAHRELLARSGKSSAVWVGLRLGASLCTLAAQTPRPNLKCVVLWDPIIAGDAYLEVFRNRAAPPGVVAFETMGFEFPERFKTELRSLSIASFAPLKCERTVLVVGEDDAQTSGARSALSASGSNVDWTVSQATAEWNSEKALNSAVIPTQLLQSIVAKVLG